MAEEGEEKKERIGRRSRKGDGKNDADDTVVSTYFSSFSHRFFAFSFDSFQVRPTLLRNHWRRTLRRFGLDRTASDIEEGWLTKKNKKKGKLEVLF